MAYTKYQLNMISNMMAKLEDIPGFKCGIFSVSSGDVFIERKSRASGNPVLEATPIGDDKIDSNAAFNELKKLAK